MLIIICAEDFNTLDDTTYYKMLAMGACLLLAEIAVLLTSIFSILFFTLVKMREEKKASYRYGELSLLHSLIWLSSLGNRTLGDV